MHFIVEKTEAQRNYVICSRSYSKEEEQGSEAGSAQPWSVLFCEHFAAPTHSQAKGNLEISVPKAPVWMFQLMPKNMVGHPYLKCPSPHQACLSRPPDCGGKILAGSLATKLISIPINFNVCVHMSPSLSSPWVIFKTLLQKQTKTRNDKPKQVETHQGMDEIRFSYWQSQCLLLQHRFISLFYFLSFLWLVEMKTYLLG